MNMCLSLKPDDPLLLVARDVACAREITLQQLLKDALRREMDLAHRHAIPPLPTDEQVIAMLRAKLAQDFEYAGD